MRAHLLVLLSVAVGCGGVTSGSIDGGGDTDGGLAKGCPAAMPSLGSSCSDDGLECEYGPDPRWTCNAIAQCSGGAWSKKASNDSTCPTPTVNPATCPKTRAQATGACSDEGTMCVYDEHVCACGWNGGPWMIDGGNTSWQCGGPSFAGCPQTRPRVGGACPQAKLECDYAACGYPQGLSVECSGQTLTWVTSPGPLCAKAD